MPFRALQSFFDPLYPPGLQWYWKADFVGQLSDEAIKLQLDFARKLPTAHSTMHMYPINGAVHGVDKKDTAFNFRNVTWASVTVGVGPEPANKDRIVSWAREYWKALHPYSAGDAYVNFMSDDEDEDRVRATYGDNFGRLVEIKSKYAPANFFRVNQNIRKAA